jgi:cell division transport system permease protein
VKGYGLFFYVAEAFRGLRANSLVNLLALGTITMIMLIVGFFLLVFFNLQASVQIMGERLEVSVYLKDGLTEHEKDFLLSRLKAEPGIRKVTYLSREQALDVFKKELKGQEALLEGLGQNPLPDSYEVNVDRTYAVSGRLEALSRKFSGYPGVEDVSYGRHGAEVLGGLLTLIAYGGTTIAVLLGVSVVFIISNSVRLALYSRGQEIELMQWIGATRGFILGPFLIEGMLLSMLGSALSIGILAGLYYALPHEAVLFLSHTAGLDFLSPAVVASLIAGGGLLGFAGGMVSVGRFLE